MPDELSEHLDALQRDDCYRVLSVLKSSPLETTELVVFEGKNGSETGPYIRKIFQRDTGVGSAYEIIYQAQQLGRRFLYLPYISDCYNAGDKTVVISEYLNGETLHDVIYRCDPSVSLAVDVFPRLCDAVLELHEGFDSPLIHRDLKPSNIILSKNSLGLIDFGITRLYKDDSSEDTHQFGTKGYAPPEQFGFGQTDIRSDVYALGWVLWFCLTEQNPSHHIRLEGYQDSRVPEPFRKIISRATALNPSDRYANVRELKEAFVAATRKVVNVDTPLAPDKQSSKLDQLSKISPFGYVQTVLMILLAVLFFAVSLSDAINPEFDNQNYNYPLWVRVVENFIIVMFFFFPLFYMGCSHKLLAVFIPFEKKITWPQRIIGFVVGFVLCIILFMILSNFT